MCHRQDFYLCLLNIIFATFDTIDHSLLKTSRLYTAPLSNLRVSDCWSSSTHNHIPMLFFTSIVHLLNVVNLAGCRLISSALSLLQQNSLLMAFLTKSKIHFKILSLTCNSSFSTPGRCASHRIFSNLSISGIKPGPEVVLIDIESIQCSSYQVLAGKTNS